MTRAARETGHLVITEDHWAQGGVADAVLEALADTDSDTRVRRLAVHAMPTSGRAEEHVRLGGLIAEQDRHPKLIEAFRDTILLPRRAIVCAWRSPCCA